MLWYAGYNKVKNHWELFKSSDKHINTTRLYNERYSFVNGGYKTRKLAYQSAMQSIPTIPVFILLDNLNQ